MLVFGEKNVNVHILVFLFVGLLDSLMLRFQKKPSFEKITETGVLTLGSMGFLLLVHRVSLGACNFTLVMEKVPAPATKAKKIYFLAKKHTLKCCLENRLPFLFCHFCGGFKSQDKKSYQF